MNRSMAATLRRRRLHIIIAVASLATLLPLLSEGVHATPAFPPGGFVEEHASGLGAADGLAFGTDGRLYVTDYGGGRLLRFPLDYMPGSNQCDTLVSGIPHLVDVAVGSSGGASRRSHRSHPSAPTSRWRLRMAVSTSAITSTATASSVSPTSAS